MECYRVTFGVLVDGGVWVQPARSAERMGYRRRVEWFTTWGGSGTVPGVDIESGATLASPSGQFRPSGYFPYDTVFSGAGLSRSVPSNLPQGNDLAELSWRLVTEGLQIPEEHRAAVSGRILADNALRLEQLLDVMTAGGAGVPLEVLVSVYEAVGSTAVNYVHSRLVRTPNVLHITVNMDTLLEEAREYVDHRVEVHHLHGVWNKPETIVTTISQYLNGLEPTLDLRLQTALEDKRVLVVGYSARDRDISPLFAKYTPAAITWLVFPWVTDPNLTDEQIRDRELEPEARHVLSNLVELIGEHVDERRVKPADFLDDTVRVARSSDETSLRGVVDQKPSQPHIPFPLDALKQHSEYVEPWRRLISTAVVFSNQGFGDYAKDALRLAEIPRHETDARLAAHKIWPRVLRRAGHPYRALARLLSPAGVSYPRQIQSIANEFAATLGDTRFYTLADFLDVLLIRKLEPKTGKESTLFLVKERVAGRASARGDLARAFELFDELSNLEARKLVGLSAWINMVTWKADLMKVTGRIVEARSMLAECLDDAYYSDRSQAAMVEWKAAELDLVSRGIEPGTTGIFKRLASNAPDALGSRSACWIELTRIGVTYGSNLTSPESKTVLRLARKRADTSFFYKLQRAELCRASGHTMRAWLYAQSARMTERNRLRWAGSKTGRLAVQLVLATAVAQRQNRRSLGKGIKRLHEIAAAFDQLGAELPAARARANAALAAKEVIDSAVIADWRHRGWDLEAKRASGDGALSDHWQIAM